MFRPYVWAIFRLRSNVSGAAIQDVWGIAAPEKLDRNLKMAHI